MIQLHDALSCERIVRGTIQEARIRESIMNRGKDDTLITPSLLIKGANAH